MKCNNCGYELPDNKIKNCPSCGSKVNRDKFPVWVAVLIVITLLFIPLLCIIGVVVAMTIPALMSNVDSVRNRTVFLKTLSSLNQAMVVSEAVNGKTFSNFDDVWNKSLKENLVAQDIENGIKLVDLVEIKYEKLSDKCSLSPKDDSQIGKNSACAILTIDVNGFNAPPNRRNENVTYPDDRFEVYLYSNTVIVPKDSYEHKLLYKND